MPRRGWVLVQPFSAGQFDFLPPSTPNPNLKMKKVKTKIKFLTPYAVQDWHRAKLYFPSSRIAAGLDFFNFDASLEVPRAGKKIPDATTIG